MPRVLELFAKRGLVPSFWHSAVSGADQARLTIEIQMSGLGREITEYIAACLRQIASRRGGADTVPGSRRLIGELRLCRSSTISGGATITTAARVVPLFAGVGSDRPRAARQRRGAAALSRGFPRPQSDRSTWSAQGDAAAISQAVDDVVDALVAEKQIPKTRNETFDVAVRWGAPPIFRLDRGAVPFFGTRAYGVHLNGYRRDRGRDAAVGRAPSSKQARGAGQARQPRRRRDRQRPRSRRDPGQGGRRGSHDPAGI